jgi:leucyl aminopeptidase
MPLNKNYDKDIDSDIAYVANVQKTPRAAGSITAAQFLKRFTNDYPWAHLDICAMVWSHKDLPLSEKGATGYGVRLLDRLVADYYESA